MITADQLVAHAIGDYILQSDWMATEKTKQTFAALAHALFYSLPFFFVGASIGAIWVIVGTHFLIDRFRLARYLVWGKNFIAPLGMNPPWKECALTGYPPDRPAWMTVWLLIIADNVLHVMCNAMAIRYF